MSERRNGGHRRFDDDAAAYVLNALEDTEVRVFEQHLAECDHCQHELAAMQTVVEVLPAGAPTHRPSRKLRERVIAAVREEAKALPDRVETPRRRSRTTWPIIALPARLGAVAAATAAAVAALVVVGVLTLGSGGRSARTYAGIVYARGASAALRQSAGGAQLQVSGLPSPPAGRIYQVWLERAAHNPVPTRALFRIRSGTVTVPGSLRHVQAVLVTAEPRPNGSVRPTRTPIIVVRLA